MTREKDDPHGYEFLLPHGPTLTDFATYWFPTEAQAKERVRSMLSRHALVNLDDGDALAAIAQRYNALVREGCDAGLAMRQAIQNPPEHEVTVRFRGDIASGDRVQIIKDGEVRYDGIVA